MNDEFYMQRCLELAGKGLGNTSPNPLVGAVIVHNKKIIGEGYHQKYGGPHAEVNAINSVEDKSLLKESKIYVSLEPCSHFGKTPPCANLIIKSEISEVIICNKDPHEKVAGKGIEFLENNGVKVSYGTLEKEGEWLNRRFFKFHRTQLPYVILKWAQTQNGFMDKTRVENDKGVNWITQPETKTIVHQWRAQEDAILVGANTVINDSPALDVRHASGKNPLRLVIDPNNKIPDNHEFWNLKTPSVVFSKVERVINAQTEFCLLNDNEDISNQVLKFLASRNILSVIIEGGKSTLESFINQKLWDEARILTGKNDWPKGLISPQVSGYETEEFNLNTDQIRIITREIRI
ncbi:MAG: diaminohydroxyphosphoribosylaminopyrimidine deaminase [Saprospiraceae bacterium]|jgi:diaminohydroxyphosphoribosylaminopyrimidine deaminase/5-amino-6-(5-phosphoribosylamino)uracil reductase